MARGSATIFLGVTMGIIGVFIYNRLRRESLEEDADALVGRVTRQLLDLERRPDPVVAPSSAT